MELLQLRYFAEVAQKQNVSQAAASLHVSQPTVSGSIKRLEAELGVELFDRRGRSIKLNDKGDLFLQSVRQAITGIDAAVGTVKGLSSVSVDKARSLLDAMNRRPRVTLQQATNRNVMRVRLSTRPASTSDAVSITSIEDVAYREALYFNHPITLRMNLLVPQGNGPHPLIVFFPGGGFVMADRRAGIVQRRALAEAGFVVASVEYRVGLGARFPALVDDAEAAVTFLRQHAGKFDIDPTRIALMGNSAGGYVATMCALRTDRVQAVVDLYGVADLDLIGRGLGGEVEQAHCSPAATEAILVNGPAFDSFPGASVFDTPEKTAEASPTPYITCDAPPFLIFHGSADTLVSPIGSMVLYEELAAAGTEAERYVIEGAPHGGPMFDAPEVFDAILAFLKRHLD